MMLSLKNERSHMRPLHLTSCIVRQESTCADEGQKHLEEYSDSSTERGQCMLKAICKEMGFDSLSYQSIQGMIEAIGIDPEKICTYCWTGKE